MKVSEETLKLLLQKISQLELRVQTLESDIQILKQTGDE